MANDQLPPTTAVKAWVAAVGATATAVATAVAAVQVALDDGSLDIGEYGTVATAVLVLVATVYGVWRAPNKRIDPLNR